MKSFPGAKHKRFKSLAEAEAFAASGNITVASSSSSHKATPSQRTHRTKPYPETRPTSASAKGKGRALEPSTADRSGWLTIYSDGACKGNGQANSVAGVGVWWGPDDER